MVRRQMGTIPGLAMTLDLVNKNRVVFMGQRVWCSTSGAYAYPMLMLGDSGSLGLCMPIQHSKAAK